MADTVKHGGQTNLDTSWGQGAVLFKPFQRGVNFSRHSTEVITVPPTPHPTIINEHSGTHTNMSVLTVTSEWVSLTTTPSIVMSYRVMEYKSSANYVMATKSSAN